MIKQLSEKEIQDFIKLHEDDNSSEIALKTARYPHLPIREIAEQVKSRQKAKQKMPTWHGAEGIIYPPPLSIEQCSSEITALFKSQIAKGKSMLDMTGGTGVDAWAFCGSFDRVDYVESNSWLCTLAKYNFEVLDKKNIYVRSGDSEEYLSKNYDWIYVDPDRRNERGQKVVAFSDCSPDIIKLLPKLLEKAKHIMIKTSPMLDISLAVRQIGAVESVFVLAIENEVKELLFILGESTRFAKIQAVNFGKVSNQVCSVLFSEDKAEVSFSLPDKYLYEPNAAIMKAGIQNQAANQYNLKKLHPNTHLFTSSDFVTDFPGRIFKITGVLKPSASEIKRALSNAKANISIRNFPESATSLGKKLKLKEGGDDYLFAAKLMDNSYRLILCKKGV